MEKIVVDFVTYFSVMLVILTVTFALILSTRREDRSFFTVTLILLIGLGLSAVSGLLSFDALMSFYVTKYHWN